MESSDWRERWNLDDRVNFDHDGERLCGVIVRTSSNPTYFHVEVDGVRFEVGLHEDDMKEGWDCRG